jgi:hypothetical protein
MRNRNREISPLIELLETRALLSAAIPGSIPRLQTSLHPSVAASVPASGTIVSGVTLQLNADVAFSGSVGFVSSSSIASLQPTVSIDWGDGKTSAGTLQASSLNGISGYDIIGTHTYTLAATYSIDTTITLRPISVPGRPTPQFILLLPEVMSTAVVDAPVGNSSGGVNMTVSAGQGFTADLGQFSTIAPARGISATIHWGDGNATAGQIRSAGVSGIDVLDFIAVGHHRYVKPGVYSVRINVTERAVDGAGKHRQITQLLTNVVVMM